MTHETTQLTMNATHILCATNSNATTTTTMEPNIVHQPSTNGGPAIDRHNPIIQDQTRLTKTIPKINKHQCIDNNMKSKHTIVLADETNDEKLVTNRNNNNNNNINVVRRQGGVLFGWGCTRPSDFISPASSSRFLLMDKPSSDQFAPLLKHGTPQTPQHHPPPPPEETVKSEDDESSKKKDDDNASSPIKNSSNHQVVVLRVSLHCRGCEKKMRKHLSKMEGVTSFTIDFMAKMVTVVGDITPLAVLMSVSKVKNAKLLTPTTISSPLEPRVELNLSEVDQNLGLVA